MNQGTAPHSVNAARLTTLGPAGEHARRSEACGSKPFGQGHERFEGHPADRAFHALIGRLTAGLSPAALTLAYFDWFIHLASAPERQLEMSADALRSMSHFMDCVTYQISADASPWNCIKPQPQDRRFANQGWELPPFNLMAQGFLLAQQWWHNATTGVQGVSHQNAAIVEFSVRQMLDMLAPSNFAISNPEVIERAFHSRGENFVTGLRNWASDCAALVPGGEVKRAREFEVGKNLAMSPGKIVYRNELIELIQYSPSTENVRQEPILIVPAWIMKYYILDLSPRNSLVKYLIDSGFTVFMISWKNPTAEDRDRSFEDYRREGVEAAVIKVQEIVPDRDIHAMGYCLGGTLLSIAAAAMTKSGSSGLKSITLLAAQTDFTDAGELTLFINESQVAFLEDMMWKRGVLDAGQMAGTFRILRSNDLVWSRIVREYLMGERASESDLMAWNADSTRMPYRMHSDYLRKLFLDNDLAEGRYLVDGKPIVLSDIQTPMFIVGTVRDHVAPWKSTYKMHFLAHSDITYVLTSGGHNAGILSPPGEQGHSYQILETSANAPYIGPDDWLQVAPAFEGSWWIEWKKWLDARSNGLCAPPPIGAHGIDTQQLPDAPGSYVHLT